MKFFTSTTLTPDSNDMKPPTPEEDTLPQVYKEIVKEKNPDQFIDLLCASHYFAGQFGNKIPVNEARVAFEKWLTRHDKAQRQSDLKKISFMFAIPVEDLEKALQSKERV